MPTNASGILAPPIAEHILALVLFARGLRPLVRWQGERRWRREADAWPPVFELRGRRLMWSAWAVSGTHWRAKCGLGMRALARRRHVGERPTHIERILPRSRLQELLAEWDHVALCLLLTRETVGLVGARELQQMRRTA